MVSVLMLKSIGNIDYDYLKEIENNIKNNISISIQDITYFLECIVYITRIKIMDDDPDLTKEKNLELKKQIENKFKNRIEI